MPNAKSNSFWILYIFLLRVDQLVQDYIVLFIVYGLKLGVAVVVDLDLIHWLILLVRHSILVYNLDFLGVAIASEKKKYISFDNHQ